MVRNPAELLDRFSPKKLPHHTVCLLRVGKCCNTVDQKEKLYNSRNTSEELIIANQKLVYSTSVEFQKEQYVAVRKNTYIYLYISQKTMLGRRLEFAKTVTNASVCTSGSYKSLGKECL
jgi:hypothetical protein